MKINDLFAKVGTEEVVKVVEVDEVRKTCLIETEDGKTKNLSFSTLKDKRRFVQITEAPVVVEKREMVPMPINEKAAEEHFKRLEEDFGISRKTEKKSSKKNLIEYNSKALTLHGWAKELGVPFGTLYARVTRFNWTYEEALSGVKNK